MAQSKMSTGKEQCFICFNDFSRHNRLPSPHSCLNHYCDKCLKDCCNNNGEEVQKLCPMCNRLFLIPTEIRGMYKDNECVAKDRISEINRKRKAEQPKCELCENVNAEAFCMQCIQSFCQKCSNIHSKLSSTSFHKVVNIQERPSEVELNRMKSKFCTEHNGQELVLYCCDCKQLLCSICQVAAHGTHKYVSSVEVVKERREAVMKYQKSIEKCRTFETSKEKNLQDLLVKYNEQVVEAEKSTDELFDNLAKLLQERKAHVLKHLKELKDKQEQNIASKLKKSNLQKAELNRLLSDCRMAMIKSTDFELVKVSDELHNRANKLINQQNESNKQAVPEISVRFDQPAIEIMNDINKTLMEIDVDGYQEIPDYMEKFFSSGISYMAVKRHAFVKGLSVIDDLIYELSDTGVSAYDKKTFAIKSIIRIPGMKRAIDLAGCSHNKALYVSDQELDCINRISLVDNKMKRWKVKDNFNIHGLSVTSKHNLLVTVRHRITRSDSKILEYSSEGQLIREIQLDEDIKYAHQTVENTDGLFILCHGFGSSSSGLCAINSKGCTVYRYGEPYEEGEHPLIGPCAIAVDSENSGIIFVADYSSDIVVMFSRHLIFLGSVKVANSFLKPSQIYFDCSTDRLHVSQWDAYGRVVIISPDGNESEFKKRCNQIDPIGHD